jgi:hypothetical protein
MKAMVSFTKASSSRFQPICFIPAEISLWEDVRVKRADCCGSGEAVKSIILACRDNPYELAWVSYLDQALRVL